MCLLCFIRLSVYLVIDANPAADAAGDDDDDNDDYSDYVAAVAAAAAADGDDDNDTERRHSKTFAIYTLRHELSQTCTLTLHTSDARITSNAVHPIGQLMPETTIET